MASKATHSGELDRRIVIQQYSATKETDGSETYTWSTLATTWAKVEYFNTPTMTSEQYEADRNTATSKVQFTIRYRTDVTKKMRVSYGLQYFDILAINEVDRKVFLQLQTESKA